MYEILVNQIRKIHFSYFIYVYLSIPRYDILLEIGLEGLKHRIEIYHSNSRSTNALKHKFSLPL